MHIRGSYCSGSSKAPTPWTVEKIHWVLRGQEDTVSICGLRKPLMGVPIDPGISYRRDSSMDLFNPNCLGQAQHFTSNCGALPYFLKAVKGVLGLKPQISTLNNPHLPDFTTEGSGARVGSRPALGLVLSWGLYPHTDSHILVPPPWTK